MHPATRLPTGKYATLACSDNSISDTAADDSPDNVGADALPDGRSVDCTALAHSDCRAHCLADVCTQHVADAHSLVASLHGTDDMWLRKCEPVRGCGCADDQHAHAGAVGGAVLHADGAAERAALSDTVGATFRTTFGAAVDDRTAELGCADRPTHTCPNYPISKHYARAFV